MSRLFISISSIIPLIVAAPFVVKSQVSISWSKNHDLEYTRHFQEILGTYNDSLALIVAGEEGGLLTSTSHYLECFKLPSFDIKSSQQLSLPYLKQKNSGILGFYRVGERVLLFYARYDKRRDMNYLYGSSFRFSGEPVKESVLLDSIEVFSSSRKGEFYFSTDPSTEKILVMPIEPFEKVTQQKLQFHIYDNHFNEVQGQSIELPYKAREFELKQLEYGKNGDAYFLVKITNLFKRWKEGAPNFKYVLITVKPKSNEVREYEIFLGQRSISDVAFRLDSSLVQVVGLYSDRAKTEEESSGVFFIAIDPVNRGIISSNYEGYPSVMVRQFIEDNKIKKGKEIPDLKIRRMTPKNDGSSTLVLEQYVYEEICHTDMRTGIVTCQDNYYYNDLIFFKLSPTGEIISHTWIPKTQYSYNVDNMLGSALVLSNGQVDHAVFNDHPKNLKDRYNGKIKMFDRPNNSVLVNARVDFSGKPRFSEMNTTLDKNQQLITQVSYKLSEGEFLIFAEGNRSFRVGMLTLDHE